MASIFNWPIDDEWRPAPGALAENESVCCPPPRGSNLAEERTIRVIYHNVPRWDAEYDPALDTPGEGTAYIHTQPNGLIPRR